MLSSSWPSSYCNRLAQELLDLDIWFVDRLSQHEFSRVLVQTAVSKCVTEVLFLIVSFIICYETLYWSGIYLGAWQYHARDIFKEVPIHCAHVYVRVNLSKRADADKVRELYLIKKKNRYNVLKWTAPKDSEHELFLLKDCVKYHFEFSPEDFEMNPEPEYGSTVEHLRNRIVSTITSSPVYEKYLGNAQLEPTHVLVYSCKYEEVVKENDKWYLSKIGIETGNLIDCVVLV